MNSIFGDLKMTTQQQRVIGLVLFVVGSYLLVLLLNKLFGTNNTTLLKTIGIWMLVQLPGLIYWLIKHDQEEAENV